MVLRVTLDRDQVTEDGALFYERCVRILAEVTDAMVDAYFAPLGDGELRFD